jgi:PAS domain S-box-containing protein
MGAYLAAAALGLALVVRPEQIAVVWPGAGLLLGLLLVARRELWPYVLAGAFLAITAANYLGANSLPLSLGFAFANCSESALAAWLVLRLLGRTPSLHRTRDVLVLIVAGALGSNAVTALLGAGVVHFGAGVPFWSVWRMWWVADGVGMAIGAPVVIACSAAASAAPEPLAQPRRRAWTAWTPFAVLAVAAAFVFTAGWGAPLASIGTLFLLPPLLLASGLAGGPAGAAVGSLALAAAAIAGTVSYTGPFALLVPDAAHRVLGTQIFLGVSAALALLAAAAWHEQWQGRRALAESEACYRVAMETGADGFWVTDPQGRILEANEAYARRSGYARHELTGMRISELEAVETQAETLAHIEKVMRNGSDLFESEHRARDGSRWRVEVDARYWPIQGGRLFVSIRDMVTRRRADLLLRARREISEKAEAGEVDGVLERALDWAEELTGSRIGFFHFVDADQANLTLQTWSTNTLANMCTAKGKGSHYPIAQAGVWADCVATGEPTIHNDYAALPDKKGMPQGHAEVIRELVVPVYRGDRLAAIVGIGNKATDYTEDDIGPVRELAGTALDVVDRLRAEAELRLSEERFRHLADAMPQLVWTTKADGAVEYYNERYREFDGITPLPDGSWRWAPVVHPDDLPATVEAWTTAVRTAQPYQVEHRIRRIDGSYRWYLSRAVPQLHPGGGVARWYGTTTDVDAQRVAAAELAVLYQRARTDAAERSDLLREVNHRTKNNLIALMGMVLIEGRTTAGFGTATPERALSERISGRIQGLLEAHEILSSREWGPVTVSELAERVLRVANSADGRGIVHRVQPSDVRVSPRQAGSLALILHEVGTNVAKHATRAGLGIVHTVAAEERAEMIEITCRDDGPGFPEDVLRGQRTGVGLDLIRMLAEGTLRGGLALSNDGGAVLTIRVRAESLSET